MDTEAIGIVGKVITFGFLIIILNMFKNFIARGVSMALAEWFLKVADEDQVEKMVRWFGNSDVVLKEVKDTRKVIQGK